MRLNKDFIYRKVGSDSVLVPVGSSSFSGMVKGNATTGELIECLKEDMTEEQMIERLLEKYDAPREVIAADVANVLNKLRQIGAIEE
ncbi:MAG: PqqD family protein [Clostridiales bacterium]|nr:PqqD family protein [Clostridiales bacterium]